MSHLYSITPFTLLDFPGETACIAWIAGCNLRCAYCHNPDIVKSKGKKDEAELFDFLNKRRGQLTGVVFSGGEPTLFPGLADWARQAKALGYKVKLDTNGTRPAALADLIEKKLVDYVALDYKCPPSKAKALIGTDKYNDAFRESLALLIQAAKNGLEPPSVGTTQSVIPAKAGIHCQTKRWMPAYAGMTPKDNAVLSLEIRTTYHSGLMTENDLAAMIAELDRQGYTGTYYIQNIISVGEKTLGNIAAPVDPYAPANLPRPKHFNLAFRNFAEPLREDE